MMALKTFLVVLIAAACLTPGLVVKEAQAAPAWYTVWVNNVGQENAARYATVTDATGTVPAIIASKYQLSDTYDSETMLFTASDAMATNMRAAIWIDLALPTPVIEGLLLMDH
jgi:hypothetical protein